MLLAYYYPSSYVAWVLLVLYNLMIMIMLSVPCRPSEDRCVEFGTRAPGWGGHTRTMVGVHGHTGAGQVLVMNRALGTHVCVLELCKWTLSKESGASVFDSA